jgi:hypothetical protein
MATFTQADDVSANVHAPAPGRKTFWYDNALEQWRFKDETGAEFPLGGGAATPLLELPKGSVTGADVGKFAALDHGAAAVAQWHNLQLPAYAVQEVGIQQWQLGQAQVQAATVGFVLNGAPGVLPDEGDTLELQHPLLPGFFPPVTFTATVTDPAAQVAIAPDLPAQFAAIQAFFAAPGHVWEDAALLASGEAGGGFIKLTFVLRDVYPETTGQAGLWWLAAFNTASGIPGSAYFQGGQDATEADRILFTDAIGGVSLEIVAGVDIPANPDTASVMNAVVAMVQGATDIRPHNYTPGSSRVLFRHFTPGTAGNASAVEHRYSYQSSGY